VNHRVFHRVLHKKEGGLIQTNLIWWGGGGNWVNTSKDGSYKEQEEKIQGERDRAVTYGGSKLMVRGGRRGMGLQNSGRKDTILCTCQKKSA